MMSSPMKAPRVSSASRALWRLVLLCVVVTGCGASASVGADQNGLPGVESTAAVTPPPAVGTNPTSPAEAPVPVSPDDAVQRSVGALEQGSAVSNPPVRAATGGSGAPLSASPSPALRGTALPPAPIGFDAIPEAGPDRRPVTVAIEEIGVVGADVISVGANPDQSFEVPPADLVGWYRFGPTPGDEGSAVLAAHIAFDGVDGVFRYLADAEVGAIVEIGFDDGSVEQFRIESITDYFKTELPAELFARSGRSQIALITCGGTFNPELRSYDSNTVAVAVPI